MGKRFTNNTLFSGVIIIVAMLLVAAYFIITQLSGQQPEDLAKLVDEKGAALLDVRNWMAEKDLGTITLLSKNNRGETASEDIGEGPAIGFRRYTCYFDGPGADTVMALTQTPDSMKRTMAWALALSRDADDHGIYQYARHADYFKILVTGDPYSRLAWTSGTPVYYASGGATKLPGADSLTDLGGGWFAGKLLQSGFKIETRSSWFYIAVITLACVIITIVVELCYKKHESRATVAAKRSEDVHHMSRLARQLQGKPPGGYGGFAYQLVFELDRGGQVTVYVPRSVYNGLHEGDTGRLVYKQLGKRQRFVSFTVETNADGNRYEGTRLAFSDGLADFSRSGQNRRRQCVL